MEVETSDGVGFSFRSALRYGVPALALVTLCLLPMVVSISYVKAFKTFVLIIVLSQIGRLLVSAVLAFADPEDPPEATDEELPTVSIVIPAYNEESVLPDTLDACLDLEYPEEKLEVVVCYEADCHDRTPEIVEEAARNDPRIVGVERDEPGGGKAAAANYAIERSTGDVIASIDADHEFEPGAVRRAVRWFLDDDDVWCVKGRCFGRNPTDSLLALHATVERHVTEKADLFARQLVGGFTLFGGGQAFFRREVFTRIGMFDETVLLEDIDMSTRIHADGKELRVDPGVITYEEQPATLKALWAQRKRWARGWLQVSRRYVGRIPMASRLSVTERVDATHTFGYALLLPVLFAGIPLPVMDAITTLQGGIPPTAYIPHSQILWTLLGAFPPLMVICIFLQDRRAGLEHHPREYWTILTIGAFLFVQVFVYVVAFLDEFVFDKTPVYVTTGRAADAED